MKNLDIEYLITEGIESESLDFKAISYTKEQNASLIKDIMAMANGICPNDKYIITGVKTTPDGHRDLLGIDYISDSSNYQQLILNNIEPDINFEFFSYDYDGKEYGIFKIFNNENRPYMLKKSYAGLSEGYCLVRKGTQQCLAKRSDYDVFYKLQKHIPKFKIPNHSERRLVIENRDIKAVIQDKPFIRNIGQAVAFNVYISLFLDVLVTVQESKSIGDIPPMGEISLANIDHIINTWQEQIAKISNEMSASSISHMCYILIEFEDEDGIHYMQPLEAGISWIEHSDEKLIEIGMSNSNSSHPQKVASEKNFDTEISNLKNLWVNYIHGRNTAALAEIDSPARELAWTIYNSYSENVTFHVNKLFSLCESAQSIGRALTAFEQLKTIKNNPKGYHRDDIKKMIDWLVEGANALHRNYKDEALEKLFWELFDQFDYKKY